MTEGLFTVVLDDVTFQLRERHDFDWLRRLGRVFRVFDQQDSGNISFGVEGRDGRRFVKYAGARTMAYAGDPGDAVAALQAGVRLYRELRHPALIGLCGDFAGESGYGAVFEWVEGESLHPHWSFPPPAKYTDLASPFYRYKQLPAAQRLRSLDTIFAFHVHVERMGFVAVDFYDGSLLYDFQRHETRICDIDLYRRKPYINTMGRLWGSSRFMSPEEYEQGAGIDERTNVFTMGATAFALLGGELDRSLAKWEAGSALHAVALRAVNPDRGERYASVSAFKAAWDAALGGT